MSRKTAPDENLAPRGRGRPPNSSRSDTNAQISTETSETSNNRNNAGQLLAKLGEFIRLVTDEAPDTSTSSQQNSSNNSKESGSNERVEDSSSSTTGPQTRNRGQAQKLKSRWMNAMVLTPSASPAKNSAKNEYNLPPPPPVRDVKTPVFPDGHVPEFELIDENEYLSDIPKAERRMTCECSFTPEMAADGRLGCTSPTECFNRMLYVECGSRCSAGDYCANKRLQRREYAAMELFDAGAKGMGVRLASTSTTLNAGDFLLEYVGEVINFDQFRSRLHKYSKAGRKHWFFMALTSDQYLDATRKGNIARYMNHSCDPNAEIQKWTVNGQIRIGFFARRRIEPGEELTLDYQFETYGAKVQTCLCGAANCRGYIGKLVAPVNEQGLGLLEDGFLGLDEDGLEKDRTNRMPRVADRKAVELGEKIERLGSDLKYLRSQAGLLDLCRLMVRAESKEHRFALLDLLRTQVEAALLGSGNGNGNGSKKAFTIDSFCSDFVRLHGLDVLWSWLVEEDNSKSSQKQPPFNLSSSLTSSGYSSVGETSIKEDSNVVAPSQEEGVSEQIAPVQSQVEEAQQQAAAAPPQTSSLLSLSFEILQLLDKLSIPHRNCLDDAQLFGYVERLATKSGSSQSSPTENEVELAQKLLAKWSQLKQLFRIPRVPVSQSSKLQRPSLVVFQTPPTASSNESSSTSLSTEGSPAWRRSDGKFYHHHNHQQQRQGPQVFRTHFNHRWSNSDSQQQQTTSSHLSKEERRKMFEQQVQEEEERLRRQREEEEEYARRLSSTGEEISMPNELVGMEGDQSSSSPVAEMTQAGALFAMLAEKGLDLQVVLQEITQLFADPSFGDLETVLAGEAGDGNEAVERMLLAKISTFPNVMRLITLLSSADSTEQAEEQQQPPVEENPKMEPELPPGWSSAVDAQSGQVYYFNRITQQTQWERPRQSSLLGVSPSTDSNQSGSNQQRSNKRVSFHEASLERSVKIRRVDHHKSGSSSSLSSRKSAPGSVADRSKGQQRPCEVHRVFDDCSPFLSEDDPMLESSLHSSKSLDHVEDRVKSKSPAGSESSNPSPSVVKRSGDGSNGHHSTKSFKNDLGAYIAKLLRLHYSDSDPKALVRSRDDFKAIVRKLTESIFEKESRARRLSSSSSSSLKLNEAIQSKVQSFVDVYLEKMRLKRQIQQKAA